MTNNRRRRLHMGGRPAACAKRTKGVDARVADDDKRRSFMPRRCNQGNDASRSGNAGKPATYEVGGGNVTTLHVGKNGKGAKVGAPKRRKNPATLIGP